MANAKICDECKKVIEDVSIKINGYKVEVTKEYGYEIENVQDFCSFNCLSKYAEKQQGILDENIKIIREYKQSKEGDQMNYDITFCSKKNCKNLKCERNQNNIPDIEYKTRHIWVGNFKECKYWEDRQ